MAKKSAAEAKKATEEEPRSAEAFAVWGLAIWESTKNWNEAIAQAFSAANPEFVPLQARDILAHAKVEHAADLCTGPLTGGEYLRLWPHRHQTDGFFAAAWQRR